LMPHKKAYINEIQNWFVCAAHEECDPYGSMVCMGGWRRMKQFIMNIGFDVIKLLNTL